MAARYFEFYANTIESFYGDTIRIGRGDIRASARAHGSAHIIPWNYPIQIGSRSIAPALAAGNCCVMKPAEEAPSAPSGWASWPWKRDCLLEP